MRSFITLLSIFISTSSMAAFSSSDTNHATSLGSAWKAQKTRPALDKNDLSMVYGGADVAQQTTVA